MTQGISLSKVCRRAPLAVLAAATALLAGSVPASLALAVDTPVAITMPDTLPPGCSDSSGASRVVADAVLANSYRFFGYPAITLTANPTWAEDPYHDRYWVIRYHGLRFVKSLLMAWQDTLDVRYRNKATFLLRDWLLDNPRGHPASALAWWPHANATAWRATVYACALAFFPTDVWLRDGLTLHGSVLADPSFYVGRNNHALNQNIALLDVGCALGRSDWIDLAYDRIAELLKDAVDAEGVTNEQAIGYQAYNYSLYLGLPRRFEACGRTLPPAVVKVTRMPDLLAYATLPNGEYDMLGDTARKRAMNIPGTIAGFAATQGASGPMPPRTGVVFQRGYAFARTGWGEQRPYADEIAVGFRFGAGQAEHGHEDGGSITLYGYGHRLLLDSGKDPLTTGYWMRYFHGPAAHDVVTVDGARFDASASTGLVGWGDDDRAFHISLESAAYAGVASAREVVFSKRTGILIIDDRLASRSHSTFRQLWHFTERSDPRLDGLSAWTRRARANVEVRQLIAGGRADIVTGRASATQGYVSYRYAQVIKAPVLEVVRSGSRVRYLTLVVPFATTRPDVVVDHLELTADGYSLGLTIEGITEEIDVADGVATVDSQRVDSEEPATADPGDPLTAGCSHGKRSRGGWDGGR